MFLHVLKKYELASKKLKNKFSMCCRVLGHKIFSRMFSFSEILVNFGKNGKKIAKNYTVSTQCTNCNSEISPPIPPRTKRHSVSYQLDSPPLAQVIQGCGDAPSNAVGSSWHLDDHRNHLSNMPLFRHCPGDIGLW